MALRVISHYPSINATGVYLNDSISVTFNKRIQTNSVDYTSYSVNDHNAFTSVPGSYSIGYTNQSGQYTTTTGDAITAIFTPSILLTPNTKYDVFVYGAPDSILGYQGDTLPDTYIFSFTTGIKTWDNDGSSGVLPSGYTASTFTGVLSGIPPGITGSIDSFYVYTTDPKNQTPGVELTATGVNIIFTGTVASSIAELSGYITVEETPVLQ